MTFLKYLYFGLLLIGLLGCFSSKKVVQYDASEPEKQEVGEEVKIKGIDFYEGSFSEAVAKAKMEGKNIFIDGYAIWCGPCKMMDKHTFNNKKVGEYFNQNFVSLKMDMERGEGFVISQKYSVKAYPTMIVVDTTGKEIGRLVGYHEPKDLLEFAYRFEH